MRHTDIRNIIKRLNEDAVMFPEFEEALVGYTQDPNTLAVYDYEKCIAILVEKGKELGDAVKFISYTLDTASGQKPIMISL